MVSSEWPVCHIADISSAQRMGAALTYARRYALFALVGIAGEDDLEATDLAADPIRGQPPRSPGQRKHSNGQAGIATDSSRCWEPSGRSARSVLEGQLSASLRESLIEQLDQ